MKPMIILPVFLIIAISVQCVLSLKQGKSLGDTFSTMKRKGDVLVGKYKNYFRGGAYIFFNINNQGIVEDARVIYGRTIFSSMKSLSECIDKDIYSLSFEKCCIQKAYEDAVGHYREAMDSKQYKAIIFDMDGTLFDTETLSLIAWEQAAEYYGLSISRNFQLKVIGVAKLPILDMLEPYVPEGVTAKEVYDYHVEYSKRVIKEKGVPLKGDVKTVLTRLKEAGYDLALATSSHREFVEYNLKRTEIYELFHVIVCGDDVHKSKPDPQIYLKAAENLDVNPKYCLAVEDSPNGIRSAYSAGMDIVMIPDIIQPDAEMKSKTKGILKQLEDILTWLS